MSSASSTIGSYLRTCRVQNTRPGLRNRGRNRRTIHGKHFQMIFDKQMLLTIRSVSALVIAHVLQATWISVSLHSLYCANVQLNGNPRSIFRPLRNLNTLGPKLSSQLCFDDMEHHHAHKDAGY